MPLARQAQSSELKIRFGRSYRVFTGKCIAIVGDSAGKVRWQRNLVI